MTERFFCTIIFRIFKLQKVAKIHTRTSCKKQKNDENHSIIERFRRYKA